MKTSRSMEKIIEEQVNKWELARQADEPKAATRPVVSVSRQPGAGGLALARQLAAKLSLDLFDREIIQQVAHSAKRSATVVETLDERGRWFVEDWIKATVSERHLSPDDYLRHLMRVVGTIGRHGGAVIVGRGASFILPRSECFGVRVIAPLEHRVTSVAREFGVAQDEARRRVIATESNRRAFVRKYFNEDISDPANYDLVINTFKVSIEDAAAVVRGFLGLG